MKKYLLIVIILIIICALVATTSILYRNYNWEQQYSSRNIYETDFTFNNATQTVSQNKININDFFIRIIGFENIESENPNNSKELNITFECLLKDSSKLLENINYDFLITDNENNIIFSSLNSKKYDYYKYGIAKETNKQFSRTLLNLNGTSKENIINFTSEANTLLNTLSIGIPENYINPKSLTIKLINLHYKEKDVIEDFTFDNSEFKFTINFIDE